MTFFVALTIANTCMIFFLIRSKCGHSWTKVTRHVARCDTCKVIRTIPSDVN